MTSMPSSAQRPEPAPLVRRPSDGRLQVGVGPHAILVEGASAADLALRLATDLVQRGASDPAYRSEAVATHPARAAVRGGSGLATSLRAALDAGPDEPDPDTLLVLVTQYVVPPEVGIAAARAGQTVLPVVLQLGRVVLGPVCGAASSGPCLHCLDLHRRDHDRDWPTVATQVAHPVEQVRGSVALDPLVARTVESLTVLMSRAVLAGRPVLPGQTIEVGPGSPHVVTRQWHRHPGCPLHEQPLQDG